jgi:hypothetical protein
MEQGFLAPHQLFAADAQITEQGVRTVRGDYDTALHQQRVVGVAGDVVATCQPLKTERMPTLCVGVSADHAKELGVPVHGHQGPGGGWGDIDHSTGP